jgi:upstream activation factor subunit UAF30
VYELSDALCEFLGESASTQLERTRVVSRVWEYIKLHNLQDPADKRIIKCDQKLQTLLKCKTLTFFKLQALLNPHFIARVAPSPSPPAAPAAAAAKKLKVKKEEKQYGLSESLSSVLGGATRMGRFSVVSKLWEYIRSNDLQNPADRREIVCDSKLKLLFGVDRISMFAMNKALGAHLFDVASSE